MTRSAFGCIEKRGKNVYRIRWSDRDGKRRCRTIHGPRASAQKELSRIELGLKGTGDNIDYTSYFEDFVRPTFGGLAVKTVSEYERVWKVELEPRIGSSMISRTTWRDVQSTLDEIKATSVQRKAFALWRKIINMAIRDGFIDRNPCDRQIRLRQHVRREKTMLEASEVSAFLVGIRGLKYEPALLCMLGCGLRLSEAVGLTWDDIEEWKGYAVLHVRRAVVTDHGHRVIQNRTKTETSTRECVMGAPFAERMFSLRGSGWIVPGEDGMPVNPATMAHNWKAWNLRNWGESLRLSDIRTIYSTLMAEAGAPDSLVSMSMGHSDGTTRGAHYQIATRRGLALIADLYGEMILGMEG